MGSVLLPPAQTGNMLLTMVHVAADQFPLRPTNNECSRIFANSPCPWHGSGSHSLQCVAADGAFPPCRRAKKAAALECGHSHDSQPQPQVWSSNGPLLTAPPLVRNKTNPTRLLHVLLMRH